MNKKLALAVLAAAVLGVAFTVGGRGSGNDWGNDRLCPPSLDRIARVAGAWLCAADFGNGPRDIVIRLSADGGVAACNGLYINPDGSTSHLTTAFGAWKRIGPRAIATTHLIQIVADDGSTMFYEKVISEVTIDGDALSGEAAGLVYLPTQDPLDPEVTPIQVLSGPIVGRRIGVERLP